MATKNALADPCRVRDFLTAVGPRTGQTDSRDWPQVWPPVVSAGTIRQQPLATGWTIPVRILVPPVSSLFRTVFLSYCSLLRRPCQGFFCVISLSYLFAILRGGVWQLAREKKPLTKV
jgi:hypothetical protein